MIRATLIALAVGAALQAWGCTEQREVEVETRAGGFVAGPAGVLIYYRVVGSGDTVVVLHGGPGNDLEYLLPDFEPLTRTHTVVFYDQRGGGRSYLPEDTSLLAIEHHVNDLERLRQHLNLARLTLIAHSFGPLLAGHYALAHPDRVARMVFIGAVPPYRGDFFERFGDGLASRVTPDEADRMATLWQEMIQGPDPRAACRGFWRLGLRPRLADPEKIELVKGDLCAASPEAIRYGMGTTNRVTWASLGDWDLRTGLAEVSAPTLVIHGEEEAIPMDMVEEWLHTLPRARLLRVPEASHFPYVERPDLVWPEIERFLANTPY